MDPQEFLDPVWEEGSRVHNWRNYIGEDLQEIWQSFTYTQKLKIAENAQMIADREHWE